MAIQLRKIYFSQFIQEHLCFSNCLETDPTTEGQDDEAAAKLWDWSLQAVKLESQEIYPKLR